ncbi:HD domain-containing protein [Labilibaculum antarcticum]|uniref:Metal-dependent phosphohydrolase n=1 Tax=Labilibaculum antarcticum TaxID=1717717 RepID=A0A1Y1CF34_9BACT|nr:HD domain-containing protein [Labilibaculum antarcticum]BAX78986.1 metal-dependent phosphohydrolase [Labilibaculum antarcticum]
MKQEAYNNIETWFNNYIAGFEIEIEEIKLNINLKRNHTFRVVELIKELSQETDMDEKDVSLAQISALLHDLGRFEQLANYGTFSDTEEINHIQLGISTITENNILSELTEEESNIVIESIKYHNELQLPKTIDSQLLPFIKILRDADKIDILYIVADYYSNNKQGNNKRLEMDLSDKPEISKKVYQSIIGEKLVNFKDVLTINDLKLYQMSLIFNLNFKKSYKIISEKTYLKQIFETLPKKDLVIDMYRQMKIHLENQL